MKAEILNILAGGSTISGNKLSQALGISRVSVWKHIQRLQELGYVIEASSRGYRLIRRPGSAYCWEMGRWKDLIHYFDETTSTMDEALRLAQAGCPAFTTVVAGRQSRGRGRLQRRWESEDGGLYFTVVLRPEISPAEAVRINLAAAVDLALALESICRVRARVKWPNDILVDGKKVAGILSQMEAESDQVAFVNVGVGVNLNNDPAKMVSGAVSIYRLTGRKVAASDLLRNFLDRFSRRLGNWQLSQALDQWRRLSVTLGQAVTVVTLRGRCQGVARDIANDGGLILEMNDGTLKKVAYGDCFHNRPLDSQDGG